MNVWVGAEEALTAAEAERERKLAGACGEECAPKQGRPQLPLHGAHQGVPGQSSQPPLPAADRGAAGQPSQPPLPGADGIAIASSQRAPKSTQDGYFSDFKLCVSTPELVKLMVEFGHKRPLLMDATFGTNDMNVRHRFIQLILSCFLPQSHCKFPILPEKKWFRVQFHLFSAMELDAENNGITVAWYVTSRASTTSVELFLESLLQAARKVRPDFKFGNVGCDDDDAEIDAIK